MAALTEANYNRSLNNSLNNNGNSRRGNNAAAAAHGNNGACPPALGPDDPLPAGYIAYSRMRVAARNAERRAQGLGIMGGACGGRKYCVCSGLGCTELWDDWVAMGCPDLANNQPAAAAGVMGEDENFGLAGSVDSNNNSNVSSIHSKNSWNTMAYKQSKQMEKEGKNKRRNTRRRRANRRRNTRSRR